MTTAAVDAAKVQPSSGLRALAQGKALPISNDPIGVCCGAATTARGMKQRRPAVGAGSGPGRPAPTRKGAWVPQHRGVGSLPTGGVYAMEGSKREEAASERRRKGP